MMAKAVTARQRGCMCNTTVFATTQQIEFLVLAGVDVSEATGNALVILMYGKYGFNIAQYVQSVRDAAQKVNADAGTTIITPDEINGVLTRITGDPTGEFEILERDVLLSHFEDRLKLHGLTTDQLNKLRQIYGEFQEERLEIFNATEERHHGIVSNIQADYAANMKAPLEQCLDKMLQTLGEDPVFENIRSLTGTSD